MAAGQQNKPKIGAIIQARMKSERLPGKVLMPLPYPDGKPLLKYIIESLKTVDLIDEIIIATSTNPENDLIESFAKIEGIQCFTGSEEDVLSRFIEISNLYDLNTAIRLTGDNPLIAVKELKETINSHIDGKYDYTTTKGLPLGMNFELVKSSALYSLEHKQLSYSDKEHVTKYIRESGEYSNSEILFKAKRQTQNLRCTIDYPSDFAMLNILIQHLTIPDEDIIAQINNLIENKYWIFQINEENLQKTS